MKIIPIVFASDENFIMQTGVCIYSLLLSCGQDVQYDIHIITTSKEKFESFEGYVQLKKNPHCYSLNFIEANNSFSDSYEVRDITKATYFRLLIPELLPKYDKIIYSDVDIIFKCSLNEIFDNIDLNDYYVAGVRSYIEDKVDYNYGKELGCMDSDYINAGFIILNCEKIREDQIDLKWLELSKRKFLYQDQDIINLSCDMRKYILPVKYNFTQQYYKALTTHIFNDYNNVCENELKEAMCDGVIHYTGVKPWNSLCLGFEDWWYIYRQSPFFNINYYHDYVSSMVPMRKLSLKGRIKLFIKYFYDIR
jgi:UDP-glucose:(galactosyl)LPS alpha-1,2-glucosyltransferase